MTTTPSRPRDPAIRGAGLLLLLTAAATVVMVFARVSADTDQPELLESIRAIAANKVMYSLSGAARLSSGLTLIAAAWFLWRTWIVRERFGTPLAPLLLAVSGAFTAGSGVCAIALAAAAPAASEAAVLNVVDASTEAIESVRWITGKLGFAAAGLALLVAAQRQWRAGGAIRRIAPASLVLGIAMQFIWVDAATIVHRISGVAFVLWLAAIALMLLTGRVERHFAAMQDSSRADYR
ncbi:MAG: hypothetical protein F4X76_10845 [Chloroflexi bacterium]|nr:hypothetical protein [Chloroflexota bacterium]